MPRPPLGDGQYLLQAIPGHVGSGQVVDAVLKKGGGLIITADHGNCEQMTDPETGGPHTAHTTNDVELLVVDERYKGCALRRGGRLSDIAPTLLAMLDLEKPDAMTGSSLIKRSVRAPASPCAQVNL